MLSTNFQFVLIMCLLGEISGNFIHYKSLHRCRKKVTIYIYIYCHVGGSAIQWCKVQLVHGDATSFQFGLALLQEVTMGLKKKKTSY